QYGKTDMTVSWRKMKTNAPRSGPKNEANPPSSTMKTMLPEWVQYARVGSTLPVGVASNAPPTAAYTAEIMNAYQRYRGTLTPRLSALSGLSRMVLRQSPKGERTMRHMRRVARIRIAKEK